MSGSKPKVAFIGTGGTIASIGKTPLDIVDYGANNHRLHAREILERFPEVQAVAEVIPVDFKNIPSTDAPIKTYSIAGA